MRFGIGRFNTVEEVDLAADVVVETVRSLRLVSQDLSVWANIIIDTQWNYDFVR
jgi:hypothetical protein